jgi:phenylacetate-CoA ligase
MREQLLQQLLNYAYENSEGWNRKFKEWGIHPDDIEEEEDLARIPVTKKNKLPELQHQNYPFGKLMTLSSPHVKRIFVSSGPTYHPQDEEEDNWNFREPLEMAGFTCTDIVLNCFSYHLIPTGFMFDSALRSLEATVIPAGMEAANHQIELIQHCLVSGYVGKPSFLALLIEKWTESGRQLSDLPLQKVFFFGEILPPGLRKQLESIGVQVSEGYGTLETGCIAYQSGREVGWKVRESVVLQICDPVTGSPIYNQDIGEIVVTLLNKSHPFIRFGTGDLSRWLEGKLGLRIDGILGRVGDGIKVGGVFIYDQQIHKTLKMLPEINYYQGIVSLGPSGEDILTIHVESSLDSDNFRNLVYKRLTDTLRVKVKIEVVPLQKISRMEKQLIDSRKK